ncbi:hypothetical protein AVEN_125173-1 [Araneus ventricosus]|uniref:Uncharacterized protein n=1 Tax=Araneus ventricosus TaxID=182803 RepID=A0A4Y2GF69_ARAVE|nr:hypothetical protein AVEN_125173-1 [Araneus ventricosus]
MARPLATEVRTITGGGTQSYTPKGSKFLLTSPAATHTLVLAAPTVREDREELILWTKVHLHKKFNTLIKIIWSEGLDFCSIMMKVVFVCGLFEG